MFRNWLMVCAAVTGLAGCASGGERVADAPWPLTPTERYSISVSQTPEQILLAPHADGLSANQANALADLVARWRDASGGAEAMVIRAPSSGGPDAYRTMVAVQDRLQVLGVEPRLIRVTGYDPGPHPGSPLVVGFMRYKAQGPVCGRDWQAMTRSNTNETNSNYGCAFTANIAALVANPADLAQPRPVDSPDAMRRDTVLGNYRKGTTTSTSKDDQASGAISNVVH